MLHHLELHLSCFQVDIQSILTSKFPFLESSTCNIKKNDQLHELVGQTALIIWDEVPMQNCHAIESVDHTLWDLLGCDMPFGGIVVLFGGDFCQTLPVVLHGSREQIVGATLLVSLLESNSALPSLPKYVLGSKCRVWALCRMVVKNWCWSWSQC